MDTDLQSPNSQNPVTFGGNPYVGNTVPTSSFLEEEQKKMFSFSEAKVQLNLLVKDWNEEIDDTVMRRQSRKIDVEPEKLRQDGRLDEDETLIPQRIIQQNIEREQPIFVNYLKNSRRLGIFECEDDPTQNTDLLEQEFTKKLTYINWESPFFKYIDGAQAHGTDAIEVIYDESKPGHVAFEQIGHDRLIFPRSATDLQACPRIIRSYDVTFLQLRSWVSKYGFNSNQVELVLQKFKDTKKENETLKVYKMYFKTTDINTLKTKVNVAWFSLDSACDDWLKQPQDYTCGIEDRMGNPLPVEMYPIFLLQYKLTEEAPLVESKGRCWFDEYKQEAMTALWSAFVNGMNRATQVYAAAGTEDGTGSALKELENLKITGGRIFSKPLNFFNHPYPDPVILRFLQFADVENSNETNQVNFAAMNREDSRKTAREITAAQQQQQVINSVSLTLFSASIRQILSFAWLIVQSQALNNKIKFLQIQKQVPVPPHPITGQPMIDPQTMQPMMQVVWVNNVEIIGKKYNIRAAGDVDVIAAEETANKMQQDWALVSQTALKDQFLIDYIKLRYPQSENRYTQALAQSGQMQQQQSLIKRLTLMLDGVLKDAPETVAQLDPQSRADLTQTLQEAQQVTGQQNIQTQQ